MQLTTIMAFITALGGLEAIKWLVRFVTFRKMDVRKEEASINSMEAENRRKTVDWFEERLEQREEKINGLYAELRKEQEEKISWMIRCHEVELIQKESEIKKCDIRGCEKRVDGLESFAFLLGLRDYRVYGKSSYGNRCRCVGDRN